MEISPNTDDTAKFKSRALNTLGMVDYQTGSVVSRQIVKKNIGTVTLFAFDAAALGAKDTGYIPAAKSDEIIAHIDLLGPRKSGEADFKAPATPGVYPYLCTFPAHYQAGMRGFLTVK